MNYQYEVTLSQDKFKNVHMLRDLLARLDSIKYSSYGSFLSAMLFKRTFQNTFDLLVEDETHVYELLEDMCIIDRKKATLSFKDDDDSSRLKIRIYDSISKHSDLRDFLLENSATETCVITSSSSEVDKLELKMPRRGFVIIELMIELDEANELQKVSAIEKIVWSLSKVGVATLLRDVRFMPQSMVDIAAERIDSMMVEHANKTISSLRIHGSEPFKSITAIELKKFGKPFAALLKA